MSDNVQTTRVGEAIITVINVYTIPSKLDELIALPEVDRSTSNLALLDRTEDLPVQCILIQLAGATVLVDAGEYDPAEDHSGRVDYTPPAGLLVRLAEAGVRPEDVQHVVITHAHGDHYNATTSERNGDLGLTFPNARYYLGGGDWDRPALREALKDSASLDSRTIGVLDRAGRLVPVEGSRELAAGITILPSPGETPGHLTVRIGSQDETAYCVGDLYHHKLEVDHPTWAVPWADPSVILSSRTALVDASLSEGALLVATHIDGIGRLERAKDGVTWVTV